MSQTHSLLTASEAADRLGVRILQLHKPATGQLMLEQVIEPTVMPRGQRAPVPAQRRGGNGLHKSIPGFGSEQGMKSGSGQNNPRGQHGNK